MKLVVIVISMVFLTGCTFGVSSETNTSMHDDIQVTSVKPFEVVSSSIFLEGMAKGTWFFEGDAPVKLLSENGEVMAQSYIRATEEWMTTNSIPFTGEILLDLSDIMITTDTVATLIFEKDNPSDIREFDDSFSFPIILRR